MTLVTLAMLAMTLVQDDDATEKLVERVIDGDTNAELELRKAPNAGRAALKLIERGHVKLVPLISLLGRLEVSDAEGVLLGYLSHEKATVSVAAAWSLGAIKSKKSVESLKDLLKSAALTDRQKSVIAHALGAIGDPNAIVLLKAYQEDLKARGVKLGAPHRETEHALLKLTILAEHDAVQREKLLTDVLLKKHSSAEELSLRLWAAEQLAADNRKDAARFIRTVLTEIGDSIQSETAVRFLRCIAKLGGQLTPKETELLNNTLR